MKLRKNYEGQWCQKLDQEEHLDSITFTCLASLPNSASNFSLVNCSLPSKSLLQMARSPIECLYSILRSFHVNLTIGVRACVPSTGRFSRLIRFVQKLMCVMISECSQYRETGTLDALDAARVQKGALDLSRARNNLISRGLREWEVMFMSRDFHQSLSSAFPPRNRAWA